MPRNTESLWPQEIGSFIFPQWHLNMLWFSSSENIRRKGLSRCWLKKYFYCSLLNLGRWFPIWLSYFWNWIETQPPTCSDFINLCCCYHRVKPGPEVLASDWNGWRYAGCDFGMAESGMKMMDHFIHFVELKLFCFRCSFSLTTYKFQDFMGNNVCSNVWRCFQHV